MKFRNLPLQLSRILAVLILSTSVATAQNSLSIGKAADLNSKAAKKAIKRIEKSFVGRYSGTLKYTPEKNQFDSCRYMTAQLPIIEQRVKVSFVVSRVQIDGKTSQLLLDITNNDPSSIIKRLRATINEDGTFHFRDTEFAGTGYTFYEFFKDYLVKPKGSKAKVNYLRGVFSQPHFLIDEVENSRTSSCAYAYTGTIRRKK